MPIGTRRTVQQEAFALADRLRTSPEVSRRLVHTEKLWQFRTYQGTDPASMIDWKQSARCEVPVVREHEPIKAKETFFWSGVSELPDELQYKTNLIFCTLAYLLTYKERTVGWLDTHTLKTSYTNDLPKLFDKHFAKIAPVLGPHDIHNSLILVAFDFEYPSKQLETSLRGYIAQGNQVLLLHYGEMPIDFPLKVPTLTLSSKTKTEQLIIELLVKVIDDTK